MSLAPSVKHAQPVSSVQAYQLWNDLTLQHFTEWPKSQFTEIILSYER